MSKPFMKSTLAFAVLSALAVSVQAQDQVTEEQKAALQTEATKLQTIVVTTAGGFEQNIADAPASISVITAEELQKKSYTDVGCVDTFSLKNSEVVKSNRQTQFYYSLCLVPC